MLQQQSPAISQFEIKNRRKRNLQSNSLLSRTGESLSNALSLSHIRSSRIWRLLSALVGLVITFSTIEIAQAEQITPLFDVSSHSRGLGLAWGKLWVGGVGSHGGWIRGYDIRTGQLVDSLRAPVPDCLGLEGYGNSLAFISPRSDSIYFISRDGTRAIPRNSWAIRIWR